MINFFKRVMSTRILHGSLVLIMIINLSPSVVLSLSGSDLNSIYNDTVWYKPSDNSTCTPSSVPTTNPGNSGSVTTIDLSYKDSARGNRVVGVTVYLPSDGKPHPLILFAPGRGRDSTAGGFYSRYLNAIATQGFVVAGANFSDNNSYGAVPSDAKDIKFLIGQLEQESQLQGKLDISNGVGLIGHSDGAMIAILDGYAAGLKDSRINAVMAEDGALYSGYSFSSGPPLFLMHGTADTTEPIASSINMFNTIPASYKALAKVVGADHYLYITDASSPYIAAVDTLTGAFFNRVLGGVGSDATNLSKLIQSQFSSQVNFQEKGNEASIVGNPLTSSSALSTSTGSVYVVGDSIGKRISSTLISDFQAAGWTATVSAEVGRNLSGTPPTPDGLGVVGSGANSAAIASAQAVVVELGTNPSGFTAANVQAIIGKIKTDNPSAAIYWVNLAEIGRSDPGQFSTRNSIILNQSGSGYTVIPWAQTVYGSSVDPTKIPANATDPNGYIATSDGLGVHPTIPKGVDALSKLIVSTVTAGGSGSSATGTATCCPSGTPLSGSDYETQIWNYLRFTRGLSAIATAGLMGNLQVENGAYDPRLNSYAIKGGGKGPRLSTDYPDPNRVAYGIVQWAGGRKDALVQAAQSASPSVIPGTLSLQLDFLWGELNNSTYKTKVYDPLTNAGSPTEAAQIVFLNYEAPGGSSLPLRQTNAVTLMTKYSSNSSPGGVSGTSSCTSSGGGGTGTVDEGTNAVLAQKILDYQKTGQYSCDNPGDCVDLKKMIAGTTLKVGVLKGDPYCQADTLDPRVLQLILYLIESGGFKIGTYALCGDHSDDGPGGHSGGFAVDIDKVNGVFVSSSSAKPTTLQLVQYINSSLPASLAVRQLISGGYGDNVPDPINGPCVGGIEDQQLISLEIPNTPGYYTKDNPCHRNHVHVGY